MVRGARNDQPGVDIKGRGFTDESTQHHTEKVEVLKNVSVETGREILARMPSGEPGLEPSLDYIVVLKLGKVEKLEDLDGQPIEDVTAVVVDYFEPESGRFARLGR